MACRAGGVVLDTTEYHLTRARGLHHLSTLDVSAPSLSGPAAPKWDEDIADLLMFLPNLSHFAARNTPAGVFMRLQSQPTSP